MSSHPHSHQQTAKNIDQTAASLLERMRLEKTLAEFSKQLSECGSNGARVKQCYQLIQRCQSFPLPPADTQKSDQLSAKYRDIGNGFFRLKRDYKAIHNYNLAVKYAETPKLVSLAFANRSAALFSLSKYKECLVDIERALASGYDDDLKPKLVKRKSACEEAAATETPLQFDLEQARRRMFSLPKKSLESVPCASAALEIGHIPSMGRCVVAAEDISPGQVLVVEEPYLTLLLEPYFLERCYSCCKLNDAMIPCELCHYVMFCDEACRAKSWSCSHKFECSIMPLLISMKFTKLELLSLKMLIRARCDHSTWNDLFDTIREAEDQTDPTLKGFVNVEGRPMYDSNNYATIHMLETNIHKRSVSDFYNRSITSAVLLYMLKEYTSFFADCPNSDGDILSLETDEYIWLAGGLMLHHNMTSASNMHSIEAITENKDHKFLKSCNFSSGAYGFLSLLNHSCSPNVDRVVNNTTITLMALRPIKKGQQIFDNYGFHHAMSRYETRQEELFFQYKFRCACEACSNKWPTYIDLKKAHFTNKKTKNKFRNLITPELIMSLENGEKTVAYEILNNLYKYAEMLEECAPCKDLADYQETIKQCWGIFSNVVPYRD
ncbi:SET and MYND domain containing, class 4, member 4 [Arctopsyche grandis]|uniref:SET and MYND domain containing, class 4, member 4 n=1 Tax=Arctopsyche grandis TaxID=121162 RepID=UPI00406D6E73